MSNDDTLFYSTYRYAVLGPMYAGKTYHLRVQANGRHTVYMCDSKNTRNSNRDLINSIKAKDQADDMHRDLVIIEPKDLPKIDTNDYKSIVLIDEVHLYQENELLPYLSPLLQKTREEAFSILVSGLWLDCYTKPAYQIFPIWNRIIPLIGHVLYLQSIRPCEKCGSNDEVIYTAPTQVKESKIGDHYMNLCAKCAAEFKILVA